MMREEGEERERRGKEEGKRKKKSVHNKCMARWIWVNLAISTGFYIQCLFSHKASNWTSDKKTGGIEGNKDEEEDDQDTSENID